MLLSYCVMYVLFYIYYLYVCQTFYDHHVLVRLSVERNPFGGFALFLFEMKAEPFWYPDHSMFVLISLDVF